MSELFSVLWVNTSPSLKCFDKPLIRHLSKHTNIAYWEYIQTLDEASSIDNAVTLLYDYLKQRNSSEVNNPIHLIGHGISGSVALVFARNYPHLVSSLTLLAVGSQPAMTWHSHYYMQRKILPISREQVLINSIRSLLGNQLPYPAKSLITAFTKDLEKAPTPDSLFRLVNLPQGGVQLPLMVCGSKTDPIITPIELSNWQNWLKSGDKLWECAEGHHYFHYFYPEKCGQQILGFWQRIDPMLFIEAKNLVKLT
ncbi:MAG: alpha/beta hydrolase [Methylacidiphilales bacterium]|nr:alpha/beta hydrolase [Candidatus Methylacidiphilales bacterium]NJR17028.1 alpha/beta hydrolase [Calothrix sp. CSU_2_0]